MKNLSYIILGALLMVGTTAYATSVFTSQQVGSSATNGYVLQTTGAGNSSVWVATSSLGITGAGGSSTFGTTSITALLPLIWNTATAQLSTLFSTTTTWGLGNNGLVMTGATGIPFSQATSSAISLSSLTLGTALSVANGGTGAVTLTGCLTGNGTGAITGSGTCNISNASVSSVASSHGIIGGTITTTGTLSLSSFIATSSAETANQIPAWTSTSGNGAGGSATLSGGFSGYTLTSLLATLTNASTTQLTVATGLQIPTGSNLEPTTKGYITQSTNSPYQVQIGNNAGATTVLDPRVSFTFGIATSTAWTGTTTAPVITIPSGLTWTQISCLVQPAGATLNAQYQYANPSSFVTVNSTMIAASSTNGVTTLSSNNTPATNATSTLSFGTPASSPTSATCTLTGTVTGI